MQSDPSPALAAASSRFPWLGAALLFGSLCIIAGSIWDISWHSTIGRDTFWTPAHVVIYLGGVVGGGLSGWTVLRTTFAEEGAAGAGGVTVWGMTGPLGAWLAILGATMMLTSAPFDDWWHNAYGLDVEILSPPHTVLALGMFAIALGSLLALASTANGADAVRARRARWLAVGAWGVILTMAATFKCEFAYPNLQRSATFYITSALTYPLYLAAAARMLRLPWGATATAATYLGISLLAGWILPLFPAEPLLAPIHNPVDRMVPPAPPLLLVAPAILIDLAMRTCFTGSRRRDWILAPILSLILVGVLLAVHWPYSEFLIGPGADSPIFFGSRFYPYFVKPGPWMERFWRQEEDPLTWWRFSQSWAWGTVSARVGLWVGGWLGRIVR